MPDKGFARFLKDATGMDDGDIQEMLKDPENLKDALNKYTSILMGAARPDIKAFPQELKSQIDKKMADQIDFDTTARGADISGGPNFSGLPIIRSKEMQEDPLPRIANAGADAASGYAFGGPVGAAVNVGLGATLGRNRNSGTGEALADNVVGGITSKFGGQVLSKIPGINKLPAWMTKGAITGAAVGGTNAAVQNLPKNQSLRPYVKHGDEVQYDPKTGKPMTQEQSVPMSTAIGGLIGAGLGAIPEVAGRTSTLAKSRQAAQTALQDLAPNSPETYQVEERLKKTLDPIINAAKYKDVPKVVDAVREQLSSDATMYAPALKKILISGLLNRDKGGSGLQNPNSMREIFHALGEDLTDKIFGKGTHAGIIEKLNSASRVSKGGDYTKYSIDTEGGGILKDAAAKFTNPSLFNDSSLGHKAEVINSLKASLGGGLPSFLPGGAKPALNIGTGIASMAGNFALHGIPDALAAQLNKLPPSARKKAIEEILSKLGSAEYDPITTQVVGNRGNE